MHCIGAAVTWEEPQLGGRLTPKRSSGHLHLARPLQFSQRPPARPSGRPCGSCPPDQPTDGRPGPGTSLRSSDKIHMIPAPAASRPHRVLQTGTPAPRPPARHISAGVPPHPSPLPQLSPRRGRAPGAAGQSAKDKLSGKRETGAGRSGPVPPPPPLAGSPGGGRRTSAGPGRRRSGALRRARPGQRAGAGARGGDRRRAGGWEGGRAPLRERPGNDPDSC